MSSEENKASMDISHLIPRITEEVAAIMRQKAVDSFSYQVQSAVAEQVKTYIATNIIPHIADELKSKDAEIRAVIVSSIHAAAETMAEKIKKDAVEKMASYQGQEVIKKFLEAIFGRGY